MKYLVYGVGYILIQSMWFIWHLEFAKYSFKQYIETVNNYDSLEDFP